MIMEFNQYGKYEEPRLILCSPGSKLVNGNPTMAYGEIPFVSDIEIIYNYNDMSELSFRTYYLPNEQNGMIDEDTMKYAVKFYRAIQKYRYIFIPDIGYFRIDSTTDTIQDGIRTKDVHAYSCEIELKNYLLPYIEDGTYPLVGINDETGRVSILGQVLAQTNGWIIGDVDDSLSNVNRSFTNVDVSKDAYSFITESLQEAYDCVFLFDILNRQVDVVATSNIGTDTDIHLTGNDLVELIKITDPTDGPYTAFRVFGNDAMSVAAVNPLGGNVVYNFSNYLSWMPASLATKVSAWQVAVSSAEVSYYDASVSYFNAEKAVNNSLAELDRLNIQRDIYTKCKENVIATDSTAPVVQSNEKLEAIDGDTITVTSSVSDTIADLEAKISDINDDIRDETAVYNTLNNTMMEWNDARLTIHNSIDMSTYFTNAERAILSYYIFEKTYTDNYIVLDSSIGVADQISDMDLIYGRAKNTLESLSEPTKEFSIDTEDFMFAEQFLPWINEIEPACAIHIEIDDTNIVRLFLSSITINYEDKSTRLLFSNKLTKNDRRTLFDNLFRNVVTKTVTNVNTSGEGYVDSSGAYITTVDGAYLMSSDGAYLLAAPDESEV